ncbi:MAG TPA: hypothetical protein VKU41_30540 [Polyangiaceae bacterium]|nr:hypothetical protein [Polyangiaceae bacterium]
MVRMLGSRVAVGALATGAAVLVAAPTASADDESSRHEEHHGGGLDIGAGAEGAAVVDTPHTTSGNSLGGGTGFKVRLGSQFHVPLVRLTPELAYGYEHFFAVDDTGTTFDWNTHRIMGGIRLGLGELIVPNLYGHLGYGWRSTADPTVPSAGGLAFDAGVALDLHLIPHLSFGPHVEYAMIDASPFVPQWLALGVHADLVL